MYPECLFFPNLFVRNESIVNNAGSQVKFEREIAFRLKQAMEGVQTAYLITMTDFLGSVSQKALGASVDP